MSRKNIINALIVIALIFVTYSSLNRTQHGDRTEWLKEHGEVVNRRENPDRYCLRCHSERFNQTKENFCNACHANSGVPAVK